MAQKRGMPKNVNLLDGVKKPEEIKPEPIRAGDYLDEILSSNVKQALPTEKPGNTEKTITTHKKRRRKTASIPRARINVSEEGRERLRDLVDWLRDYGPEPDVKASEVIEAAIVVAHEARDRLDLSKMKRRGKFGSTSHQIYRVALADSLKRAIITKGD